MKTRLSALLIGNGVNESAPGKDWGTVLDNIAKHCGLQTLDKANKPFPVIYDEIFLRALRQQNWDEFKVKKFIADTVREIDSNELHEHIRSLKIPHIITTNYDYAIQGFSPKKNEGLINEASYSVFRKHQAEDTTFWHIHGECNYPASVNLGYEHYCGQLQHMRNYTVNGTQYKSKEVPKKSLIGRLRAGQQPGYQSWIDLFFSHDIHIIGLTLDFVETDLWWLLTYRARLKYYKTKKKGKGQPDITNRIHYYIPEKFALAARPKLQVMEANGVEVHIIPGLEGTPYYHHILNEVAAYQ